MSTIMLKRSPLATYQPTTANAHATAHDQPAASTVESKHLGQLAAMGQPTVRLGARLTAAREQFMAARRRFWATDTMDENVNAGGCRPECDKPECSKQVQNLIQICMLYNEKNAQKNQFIKSLAAEYAELGVKHKKLLATVSDVAAVNVKLVKCCKQFAERNGTLSAQLTTTEAYYYGGGLGRDFVIAQVRSRLRFRSRFGKLTLWRPLTLHFGWFERR